MFLTVFKKVLWFTAIGWVVILLSGPVLGVVGTILPFALVGGLAWLVWWGLHYALERYRLPAVRDKLQANRIMPAMGQGARYVGREAGRVFHAGFQHCREAMPALRVSRPWLSEKMSVFLRATGRLLLEIGCGAIVGGMLAYFVVDNTERTVAIGALLGAAMGFVVGGPKREPVREPVQELAMSDQ